MKKVLCSIISFCILVSHLFINARAVSYKSAKEAIDDANNFLFEKMGYENYYLLQVNGMNINDDLARYGLDIFSNRPVFVYGDNIEASKKTTSSGSEIVKKVNGKDEYRALGYAVDGSVFPNPSFPYDNEGYAAKDKMWVKEPWNGKKFKYLYGENGEIVGRTLTDAVFEYIEKWIKIGYFNPDVVETYTGKKNYFVQNAVDVPEGLKENFEDFLYIIQPPTEHAWGLGIAFYYWNGFNNLNYRSFLIRPFDMNDDLDVSFHVIPDSSTEGNEVLVGVKVKSHFDTDLEGVKFRWSITTKNSDGQDVPLDADAYELEFGGSSTSQSGTINISAEDKEACLYAGFRMPNTDVYIEFAINEDGENPLENDLKNNIVSTVVKAEKPINSTLRKFDLPYYALSREISYPLADSDIVFNLNNINGDWLDGSARIDKLNVNVNAGFLHNYQVGSSRIEDNENTITVSLPSVKAKVERKDFGDNPGEKKWLVSNNTVDVIKRILDTSYYLSVSKKYRYRIKCNIHEDCEAEGCSGYKNEIGNVSSSRSGNAPIEINTYVYNGKKDLKKKEYENKISNNYDKDFKAKILWTNNPIKFDVIRYMFHLDAAGNPKTWEAVPGRYQREFVQQCSADIDWNVTSSIKQEYEQDREAARQGKRGQAFYNKVVFATDKNLISYDYPIKSGYYFNPAGKYTFEVTTVNYKTGQGKTKEHEELVNALINSFRYESNLIYINGSNQAVNIANGSYKTPGILTAKNNKGIGGKELISVKTTEYKNIANEIPYYSDKPYENENENKSHDFWKMSMEGYSLSGSLDSYTKYKYREYVAGNQKVYEITETTKVEIVVNGDNNKFYTHPKMPDGEYYIRVWLDNINLGKMSGVDYSSINDTLKGVILDNIKITVKGSIYDDIS